MGSKDTVGPKGEVPTPMESAKVSDRVEVRATVVLLLEGPNTVVCSNDPVHSLSQSSEFVGGSSSQLSNQRKNINVLNHKN